MNPFRFLTGLFESALRRAVRTLPPVASDAVPGDDHQGAVHALANEYLAIFIDATDAKNRRLEEMHAEFARHPLLGLEVLDEALVLYKNTPRAYTFDGVVVMGISMRYAAYDKDVTRLRGGRARPTTSPTKRGGGKRSAH